MDHKKASISMNALFIRVFDLQSKEVNFTFKIQTG